MVSLAYYTALRYNIDMNETNKGVKKMEILRNTTGSKLVRITKDSTGMIRAAYVQVYNGEEQVLDFKSYKSEKTAEKWARKQLA